jgi:hypothetical protein
MWGLIIIGAIILVTTIVGIFFVSTDSENRGWDFLVWLGTYAVEAILLLVVLFPLQPKYWEYSPVTGTVTSTGSRFIASDTNGGGSTQKYVLSITGPQAGPLGAYGCLDTRCALVKPGDKITLMCEPQFEFNGQPGDDCNWGAALIKQNGKWTLIK